MVKEILVNDVMHYMRGISIGRPQEALLCATAKRQQMFYLCESEATATTTTKLPVGTEIYPSLCQRQYFI
jgi:hypothetical protein